MVDDDNYDLIPHSELRKLKKEIKIMKTEEGDSDGMQDSMTKLSDSLNSMIGIFGEAKRELQIEDEEAELLSNKIDPMLQKLDGLTDQNEKIAEGILSLADMIKKLEDKIDAVVDSQSNIVSVLQNMPEPQLNTEPEMQPQNNYNQGSMPQSNQMNQEFGQNMNPANQIPSAMTPGLMQEQNQAMPNMQSNEPVGMPQGNQMNQARNPFNQTPSSKDLLGDPFAPPGMNSEMNQAPNSMPQGLGQEQNQAMPNMQSNEPVGMQTEGVGVPPPPPPPKKKGFFGKQ